MKRNLLNSKGFGHIALLLLLIVLTGVVGSYMIVKSHADTVGTTRVNNAAVLYVHGYIYSTCPGSDLKKTFSQAATTIAGQGYSGKADYIGYYACDKNASFIWNHGDPNAYFAGGAYTGSTTPTAKGGATDNTDIRHISYQLAWYIYDTYSSKGQPVDVVAHSMGGLITSWMLYQVQNHNAEFPPYLYVQDAVTLSTPYAGVNDGYNNATWCPSSAQCKALLPSSTFIAELQASGLNAQATNGTDWTAIGGSPCDSVDAPDGTTLASGNTHKVWYYAKRGATPNCYGHPGYLTDVNTALNMPVKYQEPGSTTWTTAANGPHSLVMTAQALMSGTK